MSGVDDADLRLLAAVAYGESSAANDSDEMGGIAFAAAHRCRLMGTTISKLRVTEPHYAYAWNGKNERFNIHLKSIDAKIESDAGMKSAATCARKALSNEGPDPSNGALWWDGLDFQTNFANHEKALATFKWGDPSHNIFGLKENPRLRILNWIVVNRKTKIRTETTERGRFDSKWISTAAHGSTIFWRLNPDYLKATGALEYK